MRRLSKAELADIDARLRQWQSFDEIDAVLKAVRETTGFYAVGQGGLKIWREAFVAVSCALQTHARRIRLGGDPPDFELDYGDHVRAFELVDVFPVGRRLGREYDTFADLWNNSQGIPLEHVDMEAELEALPADLEAQLQAKAAKGYSPSPILVADIHHAIFPQSDIGDLSRLAGIARRYLTHFPEVWLRMSRNLVRVSPFGETRIHGAHDAGGD